MTVEKLIEILQQVQDKSKPVMAYDLNTGDRLNIMDIDLNVADIVDLNVG